MSTPIIDYLNEKHILWMPVNLKFTNKFRGSTDDSTGEDSKILKKKELLPYKDTGKRPSYTDFAKLTKEEIIKRQDKIDEYDYIWIDTRRVQQIDVDGDFDPNLNAPYFKSVTKKKNHYFVKGFKDIQKDRVDTRWKQVELLCGQASYAYKKSKVHFATKKSILDFDSNQNIVLPNYSVLISVDTRDARSEAVTSTMTSTMANSVNENVSYNDTLPVSDILSRNMKIHGLWRIRTDPPPMKGVATVIPTQDKRCLVNPDIVHSNIKTWLNITSTVCVAKCFSCRQTRLIESTDESWKEIRGSVGIITNDKITFDSLLDLVDETCILNGYLKKDTSIMKRSEECPIEYEAIDTFDNFLDDIFRTSQDDIKKYYRRPNVKENLTKYLTNNHVTIPLLKRDQNIIAFKNGYLTLRPLEFKTYDPDPKYTFAAKCFLPHEFDIAWLEMSWKDIECPIFDKIIKDQPQLASEDVSLIFHGFLGRLHYPIGSDPTDKIHAVPYLVGTSGTGKSTIINIMSQTFSQECIGTLNYKEKTFGKTAFLDKDIIIDSDTPANMIVEFGKTDFQKAVSGEKISIPVKNQRQESQKKITQPMIFCSQYFQDVRDTGEILRRIAYFGFEPVEKTDGSMEEKCIETELHKVFMKIILARKEMLTKYNKKPFHEWGVEYFDSRSEDMLFENNPIYRMIKESKTLTFNPDSKYPFSKFVKDFHDYYASHPRKPREPKCTDVIFTKMNHSIHKINHCKLCSKVVNVNKKCCKDFSIKNQVSTYYISNLSKRPYCPEASNVEDSDNEL